MWQHEIIEQLGHIKSKAWEEYQEDTCEFLKFHIKKSVCFYFGYQESYKNICKSIYGQKIENWNLPFNTTLIEYKHKESELTCRQPVLSTRRTNLIIKDPSLKFLGNEFLPIQFLNSNSLSLIFSFCYFDAVGVWAVQVAYAIIDYKNMNTAYSCVPLYSQEEFYQHKDDHILDTQDEIASTSLFLQFLNCKNVYTENVSPTDKMNKNRIRKNKEPFYQYKILKVKKGVPKTKYTNVSHDWGEHIFDCITAEHLCRGHFKEYTEAAPLFGKYTGRFWWGPQVRGRKENGIIEKEYAIE